MARAVLMIGGGPLQLPGVRWARRAGLRAVVTDADPGAPGTGAADDFRRIDATDVDALVGLARELAGARGGLAGAYASSDPGLPAVAAIAAATATPGNSPAAVARSLDKERACERMRERDVRTPEGRTVRSSSELSSAARELGTPLVLKPLRSSGSRGVRLVASPSELGPAFENARHFGEAVRVERCLSGIHLDVNLTLWRDRAIPGGILERFFTPPPARRPEWGCQPARLTAAEERAVYATVRRAAEALDLVVGPVKADVLLGDDGPAVLELAPRFHGEVASAFTTKLATGASPIEEWLALLAEPGIELLGTRRAREDARPAGWMAIVPQKPGRFLGVSGVEQAQEVEGVERVLVTRRKGHRVETTADNRAVCGFLWASGEDAADVKARLRQARSLLQVEGEWASAA